MVALGEERAFLADTTQKLDTSLEERDRLLDEVAEAKMKVKKLERRKVIVLSKTWASIHG